MKRMGDLRAKHAIQIFFPSSIFLAKSSRKLTFLYLANDVIQNSKRKGPEFTREFESVLVDAFSHVARYV